MFVYSITISSYQVFLPCFPALLDPAELYWAMLKEQNKKFNCERFGQNLTLKCDLVPVSDCPHCDFKCTNTSCLRKKCLGDKQNVTVVIVMAEMIS